MPNNNINDVLNQILISEDEVTQDEIFLTADDNKNTEDDRNKKAENRESKTTPAHDESNEKTKNLSKTLLPEDKKNDSSGESQTVNRNDNITIKFLEITDTDMDETFYLDPTSKQNKVPEEQKTFEDPMVLINPQDTKHCSQSQDANISFAPLFTSTQNEKTDDIKSAYLEPNDGIGSLFINFNTPNFETNNNEENLQKKLVEVENTEKLLVNKNYQNKLVIKENVFETSLLHDANPEIKENKLVIKKNHQTLSLHGANPKRKELKLVIKEDHQISALHGGAGPKRKEQNIVIKKNHQTSSFQGTNAKRKDLVKNMINTEEKKTQSKKLRSEETSKILEECDKFCQANFRKHISEKSKIIIRYKSESGSKEIIFYLNEGDTVEIKSLTQDPSTSTGTNGFSLPQIKETFNSIDNRLNLFDNNVGYCKGQVKFKCFKCLDLKVHEIKKRIGKSKHTVVCSCGCSHLIRFNADNKLDSITNVILEV